MLASVSSEASFIESTIGAAVVNDATAIFYNPAALTTVQKPQLIGLAAFGNAMTHFQGQASQSTTGLTLSGSSASRQDYVLPSGYFSVPLTKTVVMGFAVVANEFNRDIEGHSILRYEQANNTLQDIDFVPAVGLKLTEYLSFGANLNHSQAHFLLRPLFGFPSLNIPDSASRNDSRATSFGGDVGLLFTMSKKTLFGLNYRSALRYPMKGSSTFIGAETVNSSNYHFTYWTPARTVASVSHLMTKSLGVIATIQYIEWGIFKVVKIYNIATPQGIVAKATLPYQFRNGWLLTLGSNYRLSPEFIVRAAASYTQSPSNGRFQIDSGDSLTLGGSMAYKIKEPITLEGSYAHTFFKPQTIRVVNQANIISGQNKNAVNALALKLIITL